MVTVGSAAGTGDGGACDLKIGQAARVQDSLEVVGQARLAAVHGGQMQEADIDAASLPRLEASVQRLPGAPVGLAREQMLAEHGMAEGLRLLHERADQVTVVDLTDGLVAGAPVAARERQHGRGAEMADEAVVEEVDLEARSDQARGHRVED